MSKKNQSDKNSKSRKDPEPATPLGKDVSYSQIKFGWVSLLIFFDHRHNSGGVAWIQGAMVFECGQ